MKSRNRLWAAILITAVFLLCWPRLSSAIPEDRSEDIFSNTQKDYYNWQSLDYAEESFRTLQLYPRLPLEDQLLIPEPEMDLDGEENDAIARLMITDPVDSQSVVQEVGTNSYYTLTGYERNTHLLLNRNVRPSPGILLIKKSVNEQETYFGLLGFTIKW